MRESSTPPDAATRPAGQACQPTWRPLPRRVRQRHPPPPAVLPGPGGANQIMALRPLPPDRRRRYAPPALPLGPPDSGGV